MDDFSALVGLPWADKGRGPHAFDCWGLHMLAVERSTGIVVPGYDDCYACSLERDEIAAAVAGNKSAWREIPRGREQAGDGVLMMINGAWHIGTVAARGLMLHMRLRSTSVIEPYTTARFAAAVSRGGIYRYGAASQ